jgi:hypothetical protein
MSEIDVRALARVLKEYEKVLNQHGATQMALVAAVRQLGAAAGGFDMAAMERLIEAMGSTPFGPDLRPDAKKIAKALFSDMATM